MLLSVLTLFTILMLSPNGGTPLKHYPHVARATSHDRVLIIAPHIDDEIIGAGGYAVDSIASGAEVFVVFLTAGDCNRYSARLLHKTLEPTAMNYLSVGKARIAEAKAAMRSLGVADDHYFILGYPDGGLRTILDNRNRVVASRTTQKQEVPYAEALSPGSPYRFASLMDDLDRVLSIARPTTVIAPVGFDRHPDHSASAELTNAALDARGIDPQRLGYLVHSGRIPKSIFPMPARALVPPARMRALTWATYPLSRSVQLRKGAILRTYKSQGAYVALLRNAFVRTNELFLVYRDAQSIASDNVPAIGSPDPASAPAAAAAR